MDKQEIRKAYKTLVQAVKDKPVAETRTAQRYDNKWAYIHHLQDVAVYLDIIE